jgi:hypothetical protein
LNKAVEDDLEYGRGDLPILTAKHDSRRDDETVIKLIVKREDWSVVCPTQSKVHHHKSYRAGNLTP